MQSSRSWLSSSRLQRGLLLGGLLLLPSLWEAAIPGNGDVLLISQVLSGKELTDTAFDSSANPPGGSFWITGRLTGKIYQVSADLSTVLREIPNPHGVGVIPNFVLTWGIAYRPSTKSLLVLAQDSGKWYVREVDTVTGNEVAGSKFEITPPDPGSAALRGLTYDTLTQQLWYLDAHNDKVVRTNLVGAATAQFTLPSPATGDTVLRGEGICFEQEQVSPGDFQPRLYVAYGDIFESVPTRIIQLTTTGVPTGVEVPLGELPFAAAGFQTQRVGTQQRRMVIVSPSGSIAQVEQVIPSPVPPSELACVLTLTNTVALTWRNNGTGTDGAYGGSITVLRNGIPFVTLGGSTTSFTDTTPLEGTSTYALKASDAAAGPSSPESYPCEVTVGAGGLVRWVPFEGSSIYDVAVNPETGEVYATDSVPFNSQGRIFVYDSGLTLLRQIQSPWEKSGAIAFVPSIQIDTVTLTNVLAVGRTDGVLLALIDLQGNKKISFPLEAEGVPSPQIGGITYLPSTQQFAFLELTTHNIIVVNGNGRYVATWDLPFFPPFPAEMNLGLTYDAIRETLLITFQDGWVRELVPGSLAAMQPPFEFPLNSIGDRYAEPDFIGGIQISANTLLVAGRESNALFRVLTFPYSPEFRRGDFDRDDQVAINDAVKIAEYLFKSGSPPKCQDAADVNDDAVLDVADPVYLLFHLFLGGSPPPPPFPNAGMDPTFRDNLGCDE